MNNKILFSGQAKKDGVQFSYVADKRYHLQQSTDGSQDSMTTSGFRKLRWGIFGATMLFNLALCLGLMWLVHPIAALLILPVSELFSNFKELRHKSARKWHGAEHAVLNAYENDELSLLLAGKIKPKLLHQRCGTNILVLGHLIYFGGLLACLFLGASSFLIAHPILIGWFIYSMMYIISQPILKYIPPTHLPGLLLQKLVTVAKPSPQMLEACGKVIQEICSHEEEVLAKKEAAGFLVIT